MHPARSTRMHFRRRALRDPSGPWRDARNSPFPRGGRLPHPTQPQFRSATRRRARAPPPSARARARARPAAAPARRRGRAGSRAAPRGSSQTPAARPARVAAPSAVESGARGALDADAGEVGEPLGDPVRAREAAVDPQLVERRRSPRPRRRPGARCRRPPRGRGRRGWCRGSSPSTAPRAPASQVGLPKPWSAGTQTGAGPAGSRSSASSSVRRRQGADAREPVDRRAGGRDEALERVAGGARRAATRTRRGCRRAGAAARRPGLGEHEGAGAERHLRGPGLPAAQPEQRRLLVAGGGATGMPSIVGLDARPSRRSAAAARAGCRTGRAARRPSRRRRAGTAASGRRCRRRHVDAGEPVQQPRGDVAVGEVPAARRGRAPSAASSPGRWRRARARCARARSAACSRSSAHASSVRRSCQTIAGWTARPVARSQTTNVSVWLAMPSAATSAGPRAGARDRLAPPTRTIASGSCSTSPGPGNEHSTGTDAEPRSRRSASSTTQRVLDVPWSSPRTSVAHALTARGARRATAR